jgi:hypothetical protein
MAGSVWSRDRRIVPSMKYGELVVPLSSKPGLPIQIALVFFCEKSFQWYWQSWEARTLSLAQPRRQILHQFGV